MCVCHFGEFAEYLSDIIRDRGFGIEIREK